LSELLLARHADCIFWLARYVERAENLARILDVNATFARDSEGAQEWLPIVQLHADTKRFVARHTEASQETVLRFYVTDPENPTSIVSALRNAHENARTLRPFISTEMWVQLNVFYNRVRAFGEASLSPGRLSRLFELIKEGCQTHTGITEGTFFRDQGWYFYQIGRYLERADQTTRLLDIKYHHLLPAPEAVGSPVDASQWNALLRSAAGYHAYRRIHSSVFTPARVAGFMLLNPSFPRSVALCVRELGLLLTELKSRHGLRRGDRAAEDLDALQALLGTLTIQQILIKGLHEFLDQIQRQLIAVNDHITAAFFDRAPAQTSVQTQH